MHQLSDFLQAVQKELNDTSYTTFLSSLLFYIFSVNIAFLIGIVVNTLLVRF